MKGRRVLLWAGVLASASVVRGQDVRLRVDARGPGRPISRYLTGVCIEDVNHEIYGGLYSQMVFGESFQEPPPQPPIVGFTSYGGRWDVKGGEVEVGPGDGPKLVADGPAFAAGEASVEVRFSAGGGGNAGLIVKVDRPETGADAFAGYEVSLETGGRVVLGRHSQNWELLRSAPCAVPIDRWITLAVRMTETGLEVLVDGKPAITYEDAAHPLRSGRVGLRNWQHPARFRNLRVKAGGDERVLAFETKSSGTLADNVSGMWRPLTRGSAGGSAAVETRDPFIGRASQRLTFSGGDGEIGIENRGLNRWGLNIEAGKPYEGYVWARSDAATPLSLALESGDGRRVLAKTRVEVRGSGWARYNFTLTPEAAEPRGRFALSLTEPGSVVLGHAFLQPGEWGRFKGLPVRKDVVEALLDQGVTTLRYGGSMINHPEYRWKKMIGPRYRRPPMAGWWYPFASNGWGILDFLDLVEAAGMPGIPAVNASETPGDMADFVEYVNGPADSPWGRKRAADGHPTPYRLNHLEIGNEEAVDEAYWEKFRPIAEAVWAKDPGIILVVGDFQYRRVIDDPYNFEGGVAVRTLAAHKKILELAKNHGREVWFDIHVNTDHPPEPNGMKPERSYIEQLGKLAPGAKYKVAVFEYNSGNHGMKRALSNALATNEAERVGELLPVACSANCLQPDGQNDNGWDQGLLFLNPSKVWLQPPGYVTRMTSRNFLPLLLGCELLGPPSGLSANAKRSEDGKTLLLQVVNPGDDPMPVRIELGGYTPARPSAALEELSGTPDAANTADEPDRVKPVRSEWQHAMKDGKAAYTFPPRSFTLLRFE